MANIHSCDIGDQVSVADPVTKDDYWNNSFIGTIIDKKKDTDGKYYFIVSDFDENVFWVRPESII